MSSNRVCRSYSGKRDPQILKAGGDELKTGGQKTLHHPVQLVSQTLELFLDRLDFPLGLRERSLTCFPRMVVGGRRWTQVLEELSRCAVRLHPSPACPGWRQWRPPRLAARAVAQQDGPSSGQTVHRLLPDPLPPHSTQGQHKAVLRHLLNLGALAKPRNIPIGTLHSLPSPRQA